MRTTTFSLALFAVLAAGYHAANEGSIQLVNAHDQAVADKLHLDFATFSKLQSEDSGRKLINIKDAIMEIKRKRKQHVGNEKERAEPNKDGIQRFRDKLKEMREKGRKKRKTQGKKCCI
ncbi:hypothetical protein LEN26_001744 [Aphanomyces euteiches]|nr:hypothetical protein AeMF1_012699 [Aphanomyces euteiches]KAH9160677.1 hypothetical protein LEN26_001744 [Aphanomyces euteiches]KAH9183685.1 hypothetical protein AeNC1_014337 [Aphanomyces euteiches]